MHANHEMFQDRPPRPDIKKEFQWIKQEDGIEFDGTKKLMILTRRQESENMALIKKNAQENSGQPTKYLHRQLEPGDVNQPEWRILLNWRGSACRYFCILIL
ncbi:hypothetical protein ABZP36_023620 [Zizania latifolia]